MPALTAIPLSRIDSTPVQWLWKPYIPRGKLALLDGDPGVGKSLITVDLAARLSRGLPMPDGTRPDRAYGTLLLSGEDAAADTTKPRAEAAGADLDKLIVIDNPDGAPLFFPARLPDLEELIRAHSADLVVIDPIMAFLPPEVAATLDQCVRRGLGPLAALAARTDCAILIVRHLRKSEGGRAIHRGLGSIGIIAAARTGLFAGRHPADPTMSVLAVTKSNAAIVAPSLGYRVKTDRAGRAVVDWIGPINLSADGANQPIESPLRSRDRASAWLVAELANGPRRASELLAAAAEAGIPEKTLRRAKDEHLIGSRKVYGSDRSEWYWFDPASAWPKNAPFRKPKRGELPPVEDYFT